MYARLLLIYLLLFIIFIAAISLAEDPDPEYRLVRMGSLLLVRSRGPRPSLDPRPSFLVIKAKTRPGIEAV